MPELQHSQATLPPTPVATESGPVVLVDDFGYATGIASLQDAHGEAGLLHLGCACLLVNDHAEVLVTRRTDRDGRAQPWQPSVHGHPLPAETAESMVARLVAAELGLFLVGLRLTLPAFRYRAADDAVIENELCPVFIGRTRGSLTVHPPVQEATWISWPRVRDEILFRRRASTAAFTLQVAALCRFADDPLEWPTGQLADLPSALGYSPELELQVAHPPMSTSTPALRSRHARRRHSG